MKVYVVINGDSYSAVEIFATKELAQAYADEKIYEHYVDDYEVLTELPE